MRIVESWLDHVHTVHDLTFANDEADLQQARSRDTHEAPIEEQECPLCSIGLLRRDFVKHISRHTEEIALGALPNAANNDERISDDDDDDENYAWSRSASVGRHGFCVAKDGRELTRSVAYWTSRMVMDPLETPNGSACEAR